MPRQRDTAPEGWPPHGAPTAARKALGHRVGLMKHTSKQVNHGSGKDVSDETIADAGPLRLLTPTGCAATSPAEAGSLQNWVGMRVW